MLRDALTYPVRDGGWITLLLGAVFAVFLDFLQTAPLFGLLAALFAAGYFGSFYLSVVGSTMTDHDRMPDWPNFTDFLDDILHPFLRLLGLVLVSFGPWIALMVFLGEDTPFCLVWVFLVLGLGCLYFPMAVLASSAYGNLLAALPHVVFPEVFRSLPLYALAVLALVIVFVLSAVAGEFAAVIPIAGWFVAAAVSLYSLVFQARLIGLIYRHKRGDLGW